MAAPSADVFHHRASLARRTQSYPPDHHKVVDAKRDLAEAKLADYIERVLSASPPFSDEQKTRLAELLRPARRSAAEPLAREPGAPPGDTPPAVPAGSASPTNRQDVIDARIAELESGGAA